VAKAYGVPLMGPQFGEQHHRYGQDLGVQIIEELYVDLNYDSEGALVIVRRPEHTSPDKAAARVERALQDGKVVALDGSLASPRFQAICVHSDTPNAVEVATAVRNTLRSAAQ
jgi:UPF0271 protein